jgi:hypothetical protein
MRNMLARHLLPATESIRYHHGVFFKNVTEHPIRFSTLEIEHLKTNPTFYSATHKVQ